MKHLLKRTFCSMRKFFGRKHFVKETFNSRRHFEEGTFCCRKHFVSGNVVRVNVLWGNVL